jgi:diguanylate cyclase (GGDEF)-like protein
MLKTDQLEKENIQLKQQLETILINARENEEKLKRFEHIELKLMEASTLDELLNTLLFEYPPLFKVNFARLLLTDNELSLKAHLPKKLLEEKYINKISLLNLPKDIEKIKLFSRKIYLGNFDPKKHHVLVSESNENKPNIKSIAILPLIRHQQIIGIFCCVSEEKNRFEPCYGNDFMKRLGSIISVCIENVINYEKQKQYSLTDPLTQTRNRRFFDQSLIKEVTHLQRSKSPLSCLLLDIDHFKKVNDLHGHTAGDEVLIQVVKRIQNTLRCDEILARYGGEEFVLLLPDTENSYALTVATRIIEEINKKPISVDNNKSLAVTISIGLATLFTDVLFNNTSSVNKKNINHYCKKLVDRADNALYQAKETGRNKACNNGLLT